MDVYFWRTLALLCFIAAPIAAVMFWELGETEAKVIGFIYGGMLIGMGIAYWRFHP